MRLDVDEGVREREQRGHKGCLCFKQHSDLRNVPLGHSHELPTANNALNVSYGWLAQTLLALLQGPNSSKMMDTGNSIPQESLSGFASSTKKGEIVSSDKRFLNTSILTVLSAFCKTVV